jgi:hypothetical protein
MVLTLRFEAVVDQFIAEGRPILLAREPYSARRWETVVLPYVRRAALESEASADSSEPEMDPWSSMDSEVAATEHDMSSADEGYPPGITSVIVPYDFYNMGTWEVYGNPWGELDDSFFHGRPAVPGIRNQPYSFNMLAAAAHTPEEHRLSMACRHSMMFWCEGYFVRYLLAAWEDNASFPWPEE